MQGLSRTRVPFGRLGGTPNKLKVGFFCLHFSLSEFFILIEFLFEKVASRIFFSSMSFSIVDDGVPKLSQTFATLRDLFDAYGHC